MKEYITKIFNPITGLDLWLESIEGDFEIVGYAYAEFGLIVTISKSKNRIFRQPYKMTTPTENDVANKLPEKEFNKKVDKKGRAKFMK